MSNIKDAMIAEANKIYKSRVREGMMISGQGITLQGELIHSPTAYLDKVKENAYKELKEAYTIADRF